MNLRLEEHTKSELLVRELEEYEATTIMTNEEKTALHDWVAEGNSIYENDSCYSQENGKPMKFLDAYRYNQEVLQSLETGGKSDE